ncbi:MAG: long-chain-fatty-acid--CoA ligase [Desulfobacterales bacterium]|nr:long-chain-fatty-acid--CoA ligase [Desulfobacterales bacterium]
MKLENPMSTALFNPSAFIRIASEHYPNQTCITYKDHRFTYRQINSRANRLAHALLDLRLKTGDRIATLQYNCNQSFELIVAAWKTGLVMVPLNTRDSVQQHIAIVQDSEASALIFGKEFEENAVGIRRRLPTVSFFICHGRGSEIQSDWIDYETCIDRFADGEPDIDIADTSLCRIAYTSGTTGTPRGVMMTYRNRMAQIANVFMNADRLINKNEVFLHVAPLTHAAGYYAIPFYLKGSHHVILDKFDTRKFLETVEREKVTCTLLVPTMIIMLLQDESLKHTNISSLKRIFYGTAPMPLDKLNSAIEIFGPIFRQNYGLTESVQPLAALLPEDHVICENEKSPQRLRSTGKRALGTEMRIVDDNDADLPSGEVGEILLRGFHVSTGYYKLPEETAETYRSGWLHTGDLGRLDEDGFLYIVDRKKDMIISGGFNIYSREVENFLDSHPGVLESAVVGLPDEKWGEICAAFIVPKDDDAQLNGADLADFCIRNGLPKYKVPKFISFCSSLPKNENNKVIKKEIKEVAHNFKNCLL